MKRQDLDKHQQMSVADLQKKVTELEQQLVDTNMKLASGSLKNLHVSKGVRQDIARVKTIITHKQLAANAR